MRKILSAILSITLIFMITACSSSNANIKRTATKPKTSFNKESKRHILIVYFSRTGENYKVGNIKVGNTAVIASYINKSINADAFEIVAKNPYPDAYAKCLDVTRKEKNENARPKFLGKVDDFKQYDTVFVGYPIWWGTMPMIVKTFLESYDLSGKRIIPFCTHEGSEFGSSLDDLKKECPKSNIIQGLSVQGSKVNNAQGEVKKWLSNLGFLKD